MNDYPDTLRQFDYLERAEHFHQAFRDLPRREPPLSWSRYFVLCHSIELAIKAYLSAHGATPRQLTNFRHRHNLTELLRRATEKGLSLTNSVQDDIKLLNEAHEKFWHRYPNEDGKPVFTIDQFEPPARELLDRVSVALRGSNSLIS